MSGQFKEYFSKIRFVVLVHDETSMEQYKATYFVHVRRPLIVLAS